MNATNILGSCLRRQVANGRHFTSAFIRPVTITNNGNFGERHFSSTNVRYADHGKLWVLERTVSVSLLGIIPAALYCPHPILDNLLAAGVVLHSHWGLEACAIDYIRPIVFGALIPKLCLILLYILSASTLGGLVYYNMNDIGIGKTIQKLWTIKE